MQTPDTPQLTPIEKAIAELDKRININGGLDVATLQWIKGVVLTDLLPYEAARDRKIADKAIKDYLNQNNPVDDTCTCQVAASGEVSYGGYNNCTLHRLNNQNHPL